LHTEIIAWLPVLTKKLDNGAIPLSFQPVQTWRQWNTMNHLIQFQFF